MAFLSSLFTVYDLAASIVENILKGGKLGGFSLSPLASYVFQPLNNIVVSVNVVIAHVYAGDL